MQPVVGLRVGEQEDALRVRFVAPRVRAGLGFHPWELELEEPARGDCPRFRMTRVCADVQLYSTRVQLKGGALGHVSVDPVWPLPPAIAGLPVSRTMRPRADAEPARLTAVERVRQGGDLKFTVSGQVDLGWTARPGTAGSPGLGENLLLDEERDSSVPFQLEATITQSDWREAVRYCGSGNYALVEVPVPGYPGAPQLAESAAHVAKALLDRGDLKQAVMECRLALEVLHVVLGNKDALGGALKRLAQNQIERESMTLGDRLDFARYVLYQIADLTHHPTGTSWERTDAKFVVAATATVIAAVQKRLASVPPQD